MLSIKEISKEFPGVRALDNINIDIFNGEIHALVGENGAGKSTLVKILGGILRPDKGQIFLDSQLVDISNPHSARLCGISIVHQELSLILKRTVSDNIFLGLEPTKGGWVNTNRIISETKKILGSMGTSINPNALLSKLNISQRQIIEICKAIVAKPKVIALDEPTGSLMINQVEELFKIIHKMEKLGVTIIYISHRIEEIVKIADRVTVLRDGIKVGTLKKNEINEDKIISMMVGRKVNLLFPKLEFDKGGNVLEVKNLSTIKYFKNISFSLKKGEILGIGGLIGCYKKQLGEALFGLIRTTDGEIFINRKRVNINNTFDAIRNGIGYIPEDRNSLGLILNLPIDDNITLTVIKDLLWGGIFFNFNKQYLMANNFIKSLSIKVKNLKDLVLNLSGGNRQKVLLAKWLSIKSLSILILNEPTHGIDVATKVEIHKQISKLAKEGLSIILITSELLELMGMSDRIIVMSKGIITEELSKQEFNQEKIMKLAYKRCKISKLILRN
ncbi:Galactose/methyl galactoside import ATP-binding protein MglA [subsurface metagenome]